MEVERNWQNAGPSFNDFPDEILVHVMTKVSATSSRPSDIVAMSSVCKRWQKLSCEAAVLCHSSRFAVAVTTSQWSPGAENYLQRAAKAGCLEAAYMLGMILFYCIPSRRPEGGRLLVQAGRQGHAGALLAAAVISFNGSGWGRASKDARLALSLCARAAALGHVGATRELAHCFMDGYGTKRDPGEGWRLLLLAHLREGRIQQEEGSSSSSRAPSLKRREEGAQLAGRGKRQRRGEAEGGEGGEGAEALVGVDRQHWDVYGNTAAMDVEQQTFLLNDLLHRSKARFETMALASSRGKREAGRRRSGGNGGGEGICPGQKDEGDGNEESLGNPLSAMENPSPRESSRGGNAPECSENSSLLRISSVRSRAAREVIASVNESGARCHAGTGPQSEAAQEIMRDPEGSGSAILIGDGGEGPGEEVDEEPFGRNGADGESTNRRAPSPDSPSSPSSHDCLRVEDIAYVVQTLGQTAPKEEGEEGEEGGREEAEGGSRRDVKSIVSFLQASSVEFPPHPAHAFLLDWFDSRRRGGGEEGAGEDMGFCKRSTCGRPETRSMEFWRCSTCWTARYCSRTCQLQDWRHRHSAECRPNYRNMIPRLGHTAAFNNEVTLHRL